MHLRRPHQGGRGSAVHVGGAHAAGCRHRPDRPRDRLGEPLSIAVHRDRDAVRVEHARGRRSRRRRCRRGAPATRGAGGPRASAITTRAPNRPSPSAGQYSTLPDRTRTRSVAPSPVMSAKCTSLAARSTPEMSGDSASVGAPSPRRRGCATRRGRHGRGDGIHRPVAVGVENPDRRIAPLRGGARLRIRDEAVPAVTAGIAIEPLRRVRAGDDEVGRAGAVDVDERETLALER